MSGLGFHRAGDAEARGEGICRTCLEPIWNEGGTVGHRHRPEGWSDRIERGGDSLVCFKAVHYRHVPLEGREAAVYDRAYARGADSSAQARHATGASIAFVPEPYVVFDSHESAIQHGGIQHIRDLRDAGRRAIEAATGEPPHRVRIQCHGGVHNIVTFSVVAL